MHQMATQQPFPTAGYSPMDQPSGQMSSLSRGYPSHAPSGSTTPLNPSPSMYASSRPTQGSWSPAPPNGQTQFTNPGSLPNNATVLDDDALYFSSVPRTMSLNQLGQQSYFPSQPNHAVNLSIQQIQQLFAPSNLVRVEVQSPSEQLVLPAGKLLAQNPAPIVSVPVQMLQSYSMLSTPAIPAIDPNATLIGSIGGTPARATTTSPLSSVHVLLDVPEAALAQNALHLKPTYLHATIDNVPIPTVRHHFPVFDPISLNIVHPGNERQELVLLAKQAAASDRFNDMALLSRQLVVQCRGNLSKDERILFLIAHKRLLLPLRQSIRSLKQVSSSPALTTTLAAKYTIQLHFELITLCKSLIEFVLSHILRATLVSAENHIVFLKFLGDLYRYIAEADPRDEDVIRLCRSYYHDAALLAERYLPITSPIRLGLLLNYSVAAFELFNDYRTACDMVRCAFDKAVTRLDGLLDEDFRDSTLLLQLMKDNLVLWVNLRHVSSTSGTQSGQGQPADRLSSAMGDHQRDNQQGPVIFPTAYEIQSANSQALRFPVQLPVNNASSYLIPRMAFNGEEAANAFATIQSSEGSNFSSALQ